MATINKSFTALGNGKFILLNKGETFSYSVSDSFVGTVVLEYSHNGGLTWILEKTITVVESAVIKAKVSASQKSWYRFRCSEFTSGTIVTVLQDVSDQLSGGINTLTDAPTIATDCDDGNVHEVTLEGNRTLGAPTNIKPGTEYKWFIDQDGTGSRTLSYNAVFKFQGGVVPSLSVAANSVDILVGIARGTNIHCTLHKGSA